MPETSSRKIVLMYKMQPTGNSISSQDHIAFNYPGLNWKFRYRCSGGFFLLNRRCINVEMILGR